MAEGEGNGDGEGGAVEEGMATGRDGLFVHTSRPKTRKTTLQRSEALSTIAGEDTREPGRRCRKRRTFLRGRDAHAPSTPPAPSKRGNGKGGWGGKRWRGGEVELRWKRWRRGDRRGGGDINGNDEDNEDDGEFRWNQIFSFRKWQKKERKGNKERKGRKQRKHKHS